MNEKTVSNNSIKELTWGMHDAVVNGELHRDIPSRLIFVANTTERDALEVYAGQFVATYGCVNVWQKDVDGEWAVFDLV